MNSPHSHPDAHEVEVSLFGPGYGESVVIHVGGGKWLIVDSCVQNGFDRPAPLRYLRQIGVDTAQDVLLIVASHWHDDHIRGLSAIVEECTSALFGCSSAMISEQFITLGRVYARSEMEDSGLNEFSRIHGILSAQGRVCRPAVAGRLLLNRTAGVGGVPFDVRLYSLSPCDEAQAVCVRELAAIVCDLGPRRRMPTLGPNQLAVVLQLTAGADSILLGSDMENSGLYGWQVVVNDATRPQVPSMALKVPHHGSSSAHNDDVWMKMLHTSPYAFLTPFIKGNVSLPTYSDVKRIKRFTDKSYMTMPRTYGRTPRHPIRWVDQTLKKVGITVRPVTTSRGHIRFRFAPGQPDSQRVDLFHGAQSLA